MSDLVRVTAPYFCAGAEYQGQRCVRAAPIIKYFVNMSRGRARMYVKGKGWKWQEIPN